MKPDTKCIPFGLVNFIEQLRWNLSIKWGQSLSLQRLSNVNVYFFQLRYIISTWKFGNHSAFIPIIILESHTDSKILKLKYEFTLKYVMTFFAGNIISLLFHLLDL